ncbi:MAG TPA: hypothetical protein DFS52_23995 [Myxococcales bacterium]|jgi:hypothetical protein|nr:hypothetical protein [Myxococcales bacterium]
MMKRAVVLMCLAGVSCAPSINPQMQQATDALLASVKAGHDLAAPAAYEPMPWEVGQWVLLKITDSKQQPSIQRVSVVGREGEALWVETETQDYYRHTLSKVLYAKMPRTPQEAVEAMQKMVSKTDDQPQEVFDFTSNDPGTRLTKNLMKSFAQGVVVAAVDAEQVEDATVPAGTFRGCAKVAAKAVVGPVSKDTTSWFHPAVPVNGSVKGLSNDGEWTVELLDFGLTGAQSKL